MLLDVYLHPAKSQQKPHLQNGNTINLILKNSKLLKKIISVAALVANVSS